MFQRGITIDDLIAVVDEGHVIMEFPERVPQPSRILLAWRGDRALHLVCVDGGPDEVVVITAYWADPNKWDASFRKRR